MNIQKFTQKSVEAIQLAQQYAAEHQNPQIEQEHLLYALISQQEGLIGQLLIKMNVDQHSLVQRLKTKIGQMPRVSGGGQSGNIYVAGNVEAVLNLSEQIAERMKDEYVSVEHIMMALIEQPNETLKALFREFNITKDSFAKVLATVRGNTRVTSDNPESTYDVLEKYGSDLVALAREHKLDPVIGRDSEIRNVIRILSRKTKNNPVLIGEPGVGKTAIAEGLALRIVRGDVPDNLKERKVDDATLEELKDTFLLNDSVTEEDEEEGDSKPNEKKFYQIETKITFTDGENEDERVQTFVVNTFNVDRAMMLITHYLKNKEEECEKQAKEKGHEFRKREIHTAIESAKPIPVGRFIPKEFSMAYME